MAGRCGAAPGGRPGGVDRKTARRYVLAAVEAGLTRDGGTGQLTDELVGQVEQAVRPVRPGGHGQPWELLEARRAELETQVKAGALSVVKIGVLLQRQGVAVPYRTLHGFCVERCGFGRTAATMRVADGEPGAECQLDFGHLAALRGRRSARFHRGDTPVADQDQHGRAHSTMVAERHPGPHCGQHQPFGIRSRAGTDPALWPAPIRPRFAASSVARWKPLPAARRMRCSHG